MTTLRNNVQLIGNLGNDPEVKHLDNGGVVAKFRLATSESYTDKNGEKVTNTEWHNLVAWGGKATIIEKYLKKGNKCAVQGKLTYRKFDDKNGNTKYFTEITVNEVEFLNASNKS